MLRAVVRTPRRCIISNLLRVAARFACLALGFETGFAGLAPGLEAGFAGLTLRLAACAGSLPSGFASLAACVHSLMPCLHGLATGFAGLTLSAYLTAPYFYNLAAHVDFGGQGTHLVVVEVVVCLGVDIFEAPRLDDGILAVGRG